jgi:hypothetical protein
MKNLNFSKTGEKCPKSGEWIVLEDMASIVILHKGDEMPAFKGRSVTWQLKTS